VIGGLVGNLVAALVAGWFGVAGYERFRRRKVARTFAAGPEVVVPGSVLGDASYCHPPGGFLAVGDRTLTWLTGVGGKRYPVPIDRLTVRSVDRGPGEPTGPTADVVCADAVTGARVTVRVLRADLAYLATVLPLGHDRAPAVRPAG